MWHQRRIRWRGQRCRWWSGFCRQEEQSRSYQQQHRWNLVSLSSWSWPCCSHQRLRTHKRMAEGGASPQHMGRGRHRRGVQQRKLWRRERRQRRSVKRNGIEFKIKLINALGSWKTLDLKETSLCLIWQPVWLNKCVSFYTRCPNTSVGYGQNCQFTNGINKQLIILFSKRCKNIFFHH